MQHHCTSKSYMKATTPHWKAPCLCSSIYQPAVKNICMVKWIHNRFHCCISQGSLPLFIRFYVGKVKAIGISEEQHCSLPISINLFFCKTKDFPVVDKISIQKPDWVGKCHIGYKCHHSLKWLIARLWLGSNIVLIEKTSQKPHPHWQHLEKTKNTNKEHWSYLHKLISNHKI